MSMFSYKDSEAGPLLYLPKISSFRGEVNVIGSKSIANRALLLAALSKGTTTLHNVPDADDVQVMVHTLPKLGVAVESVESEESAKSLSLKVTGAAGPLPVTEATINVDNAGTVLRPLIAVLSAGKGSFVVDGNEQMRRRPVSDLVESLRRVGVDISCSPIGAPPVSIRTQGWQSQRFEISGKTSSQFVSALLMAAPLSSRIIEIELPEEPVSKPYIDMTIQMMQQFGVNVERKGYTWYRVEAGQSYTSPGSYFIEGDATAATYFMTAGLLSGPVRIWGLDEASIQGDIAYLDVIRKLGGKVSTGKNYIEIENNGTIRSLAIDMNDMPDAAMTLAVTGLFADSFIEVQNVANMRVKESERIKGLRTELEKLGAAVDEWSDGLRVHRPEQIRSAQIETYKDHRMAMSFSLAAAATDLTILDPACVNKTYPRYFGDFERICQP